MKFSRRWTLGLGAVVLAACSVETSGPALDDLKPSLAAGFDAYGYNDVAGIFNALADGVDRNLDGKVWGDPTYANDHLVMKWNKDWDRGNDENWSNPPYAAWTSNEWNGQVAGGSGETWHYKFKWVGNCVTDPSLVPEGGYCIWGQFAVILSHGTYAGQHFWDAAARAGLGN